MSHSQEGQAVDDSRRWGPLRAHSDANLNPINLLVPKACVKDLVRSMWAHALSSHSTSGSTALIGPGLLPSQSSFPKTGL